MPPTPPRRQRRSGGASPIPTLRGAVRAAVARAWARAIASGALPALDEGPAGPEIRIERPANPEHGDAATNLAMRLARPYHRAPLEIAGALAEELAREIADSPATTPLARWRSPRPGSSTLRYADRALRAVVEGIVARGRIPPAGVECRPSSRATSTWSSSRPTRPVR